MQSAGPRAGMDDLPRADAGNSIVGEWCFECEYDGVTIANFDAQGKIERLREFQSRAEHVSLWRHAVRWMRSAGASLWRYESAVALSAGIPDGIVRLRALLPGANLPNSMEA